MLPLRTEPRSNRARRQARPNGCRRMDFSKTGIVAGAVATALVLSTATLADTIVGPLRFSAESLRVVDLRGTLNIEVTTANRQFSVVIDGDEDNVDGFKVRTEGNVLVIEQEGRSLRLRDILTFGFFRFLEDNPKVTVSVPPRTPLTVDNFVGEIRAGDLDAPLALEGRGSVKGRIGNVTEAEIDLSGSAEIALGKVSGRLGLELSGSSDIRVVSSGTANIDVSGSTDVQIGPINGGLNIHSSGSTKISVASVRGDVSIRSSGSSDINIDGGQADTFLVKVSGAANISFAGNASNPDIDVSGSASIKIGSVTGQLRSRGGGNVVIGD